MEDKSKKTNISFPKKVWYSIDKIEKYAELSAELKEIEIKLNICRERFYE